MQGLANFGRKLIWRVVCLLALGALVSVPLLSRARTQPTAIQVVNNSGQEIRHLYLSPADRDEWSPDQLNNSVIHTGETYTLDSVSCGQSEIKLIAEDQNGCFFSQVVACSAGSTWTIPAGATPNCGN